MATATVLVYMNKAWLGEDVAPLPTYDGFNFEFLVSSITIGNIELWAQRTDGGMFSTSFMSLPFRYVIIPGGTSASGKVSPDFKKMSYKEVLAYFGVED